MGLHFSRIWERMFGKKEMRILMVGLDAAGKVRTLTSFCLYYNIIFYRADIYCILHFPVMYYGSYTNKCTVI
jgi:hypothetical protein